MTTFTFPTLSLLSAVSLAVTGCGGAAEPAPASPADPADPAGSSDPAVAAVDDVEQACLAVMHRMRECSAEFIPALVDLRIAYDRPPGIAAEADARGRDTLVELAAEEWKTDSSDDNLAAMCAAESREIPVVQELVDAGRACLEQASCDDVVTCVIPLIEAPWKAEP